MPTNLIKSQICFFGLEKAKPGNPGFHLYRSKGFLLSPVEVKVFGGRYCLPAEPQHVVVAGGGVVGQAVEGHTLRWVKKKLLIVDESDYIN